MKFFRAALFIALFVFTLSAQTRPVQPVFSSLDMKGNTFDLAALRGKVVVFNLWFVNCPNCIEEIGKLNALVDEYKNDPSVVFVAPAASKKADLERFLKKYPFQYRVLPDSALLMLRYFGTPDKDGQINIPFPMHIVVDREGRVAAKEQGIKGISTVREELKREIAPVASRN